jgi:hypothetical protein
MPNRSISFLFIFSSLILSIGPLVFATPQTYEEYAAEAGKYCDSAERTWSEAKSLVPKIDYSEFTTPAVNNALSRWRSG